MMKTKTDNTFKRTLLSALVISVVAGSFLPWEEYEPNVDNNALKLGYQDSDIHLDAIVTQSMANIDSDTLATIAEDNLTAALNAEMDAQSEFNAFAYSEQMASPEADEPYDQALEAQQIAEIKNDSNGDLMLDEQANQNEVMIRSEAVSNGSINKEASNNEPLYILESPLLFAFDSSEINPNYYEALNDSARYIQDEAQSSDTVWQVVGYADLSGNALYNSKLAKRRAQKVAAYLVDKGVEEAQLSIVSLGASSPLHRERSVKNNRDERRVEIHRYQAEVTALANQYHKQLNQPLSLPVAQHTKSLPAKQVQPIVAQQQAVIADSLETNRLKAKSNRSQGSASPRDELNKHSLKSTAAQANEQQRHNVDQDTPSDAIDSVQIQLTDRLTTAMQL